MGQRLWLQRLVSRGLLGKEGFRMGQAEERCWSMAMFGS